MQRASLSCSQHVLQAYDEGEYLYVSVLITLKLPFVEKQDQIPSGVEEILTETHSFPL